MFYDASRDPAAVEIATNLRHDVSTGELFRAFSDAEPERQLCIICILEASAPGEPLTAEKKSAVERLLTKINGGRPQ